MTACRVFLFSACIALLGVAQIHAQDAIAKLPLPTHRADVFICDAHYCATPLHGAFPHLVLGLFKAAATPLESQQLFAGMRQHDAWGILPDDADAFERALQPVSITLPNGSVLGVLMTQDEAQATSLQPGDLVRYSPHRGQYEMPPTNPKQRPYWAVDGCVAVICRASDKACFKRYDQGVFRAQDGVELSPSTYKPRPHGRVINPDSLLPVLTVKAGT